MKKLLYVFPLTTILSSSYIFSANSMPGPDQPPQQPDPQEVPRNDPPDPQPVPQPDSPGDDRNDEFTDEFRISDCTFQDTGVNPYLSLEAGKVSRFEDGNKRMEISTLEETRPIEISEIGSVSTRVVEKREWEGEQLVKVTRNFYSFCQETRDVYNFGAEINNQDDSDNTQQDGWIAGANGNRPGLIMPGTFLLGSKYHQALAPNVAMERAEHTKMKLEIRTNAGGFSDCVEVRETDPLVESEMSTKVYCPDVGLVKDNDLELEQMPQGPTTDEQPNPPQPSPNPEQPAPSPEQPAPIPEEPDGQEDGQELPDEAPYPVSRILFRNHI